MYYMMMGGYSGIPARYSEYDGPPRLNAIDHKGNILLSSDDFPKAIIKYGTKFISRFPRSEFFKLVEPKVQSAIEIEKQKN